MNEMEMAESALINVALVEDKDTHRVYIQYAEEVDKKKEFILEEYEALDWLDARENMTVTQFEYHPGYGYFNRF